MTTLLIAEHDNAHLKDATHKALSAATGARRAGACAGGRLERPRRGRSRRQAREAWRRCCWPMALLTSTSSPSRLRP